MHVHYFHGIHQANVLWPTGSEGAFLASRIAIMVMHVTNASSCMCIVQAMCDIYLLGSIWLVPKQVVMLACAFMTYMCIHELAGAYYHFIIFLVPRPIPLAMADSSFRNVRPRLLDRASASQDEIGGHHCIVLQGQDFQPYPVDEMHCFIGIYHKIQFLNGKSMWKSQEIGGKSPWSPKQTAYLWWSCVYKMYFLSRKPLVERDHDFNFQDWDSLKIVASFSEDLQVAYLPWNAYEECCLVRWMSFLIGPMRSCFRKLKKIQLRLLLHLPPLGLLPKVLHLCLPTWWGQPIMAPFAGHLLLCSQSCLLSGRRGTCVSWYPTWSVTI